MRCRVSDRFRMFSCAKCLTKGWFFSFSKCHRCKMALVNCPHFKMGVAICSSSVKSSRSSWDLFRFLGDPHISKLFCTGLPQFQVANFVVLVENSLMRNKKGCQTKDHFGSCTVAHCAASYQTSLSRVIINLFHLWFIFRIHRGEILLYILKAQPSVSWRMNLSSLETAKLFLVKDHSVYNLVGV